jgi:hemin uptake protein HemP
MMTQPPVPRADGTPSRRARPLRGSTLSAPQAAAEPAQGGVAPLELDSDVLFQGGRELHIRHNGSLYRLSITRFEKLLLTK